MMGIRDERGFTLIELLVAMAITTVVFGSTLSILDVFQSNNRFDQFRNENQDTARTTLDRLSRQLRNIVARTTSEGTVPGALELAEPYEVAFETIDTTKATSEANTVNAMRVRYCLDDSKPENEILWEQVRRWTTKEAPALPTSTSCPDRTKEGTSEADWNTSTQVVQHVTNRLGGQGNPKNEEERNRWMFTYSAKESPQILSVEANVFLNINPKQTRPGESQLTSGVSLRNANRVPVAEFIATEEGNRQVRLNASASYDPDGLSLTYKWLDNGEELLTTSQQYETKATCQSTKATGFCTNSKQKFKLIVTNPGGLSAYTEKEVTIK
ncbi:MAG TPA: prepilin-type N-terminal cleavage/methylation domain-containing protein [Solirubrobacteraceae bacterium]|jgi:prepilin-type N-terminal cleavage/methylation domain-containing protein